MPVLIPRSSAKALRVEEVRNTDSSTEKYPFLVSTRWLKATKATSARSVHLLRLIASAPRFWTADRFWGPARKGQIREKNVSAEWCL